MNKKNIIIMILVTIIILLLCTSIYFGYKYYHKTNTIIGEVLIVSDNYILIDSNDTDYVINHIDTKYNVGDKVSIKYLLKDLNEDEVPYTIKASSIEIIKLNTTTESITEDNESKESSSNNVTSPSANINTSDINTPNSNANSAVTTNADEEVVPYLENLENSIETSSIKDTVKSGFISTIDFIFYNGTIKGHTFSELSNTAKLKVLKIALYFDSKVDAYFPGYKEEISTNSKRLYTSAKSMIVEKYLDVTTKVCENNSELCTTAKENFNEMKNTFGLTWSLIKDIAGDGLSKLKSWYEIWSNK